MFDVAGTIHLKADLKTNNDNLTIAGQTSPGGICLADYAFVINSDEVIIRFLRFRPGDDSGKEPDGLGGMDKKNIIIDHCSVSWSVDECLSVYGMENSTVQWCIAAQALRVSVHGKGTHCYGGNWGGNKASYHHNLIAHCESRVPRLGPRASTQLNEYVDIRNNVFYNWAGEGCYGAENQNINIVDNYYKPGPATEPGKVSYRIANPSIADQKGDKLGLWYIADNYIEGASEEAERVRKDNWDGGVQIDDQSFMSKIKLDEPWKVTEPVTQHSPQEAYELVLEKVGATYPQRDPVDTRIINEVRTGVATYEGVYKAVKRVADASKISGIIDTQKTVGGWPELKSEPAPLDSDHDGMPDEWELRYGLNPNDASDGSKKYDDGYTYVEKYINSLCD